MIKLAQSKDGRLIIMSNQPFQSNVSRVEYYRDQKLMMLSFQHDENASDLMPCEISAEVDEIIRQSPDILVIAMAGKDTPPYGYEAPLIQIGL